MLKYKDYAGIFEFDENAEIYTGEVIGIHSVVTFQGRTMGEVERSFMESIDLYLEICGEDGVLPDKPEYIS